ncbi:ANL family adenylate-forming protein [Aquabacterium sp. UBA2148]|uniref:ANL family adenylate-forming protein n=1 Tax=Aquabacterium sp. UBA2148 TaxID=1946042 RepID=UPI00257F1D99|nr:fatty acid--CoA ligase family protein [Aquabacterium sp. UBA2148]
MSLVETLQRTWGHTDDPFLVSETSALRFADLAAQDTSDLASVRSGDVVALIGDFEPRSISRLLTLFDRGCIVVPLTEDTAHDHAYFFDAALVDVVVQGDGVSRRAHGQTHPFIEQLRAAGHPGLVLFSSGTTGRPKAILHDFTHFLKRFNEPRPTLKTLNFLLFDHIGGLNTLLHTLFNRGTVVAATDRSIESVLRACRAFDVELLPTTPTFLRMMLMSGAVPGDVPPSLKVITYGTEKMDQPTLDALCRLLPQVDFRQTFGMSELGILRVKSRARDSLFMKVGGEGVETRVDDQVLKIRSQTRMLGYLNADSPFDDEGWYNTKDVVEQDEGWFRVNGRVSDVINVGGLKFMAADVERVALEHPDVSLAKAVPRSNPITGQHVEMTVQTKEGATLERDALMQHLTERLPRHMVPRRITLGSVAVGHRFKKA